jgi:AraC-like DNA-binding protein
MMLSQLRRDAELPAGAATLVNCLEFADIRFGGCNDQSLIVFPQQARLQELVANVEDLVARPVQDSAALRHLRRYLEIVPGPDDVKADPDLNNHIARTLTDLVVLALGAEGDAAELARTRGLRAARLQQIIAEIRGNFSDPAFSTHILASRLGVTARYVQRLLYETGSTFHERMLELRLQRARAMLIDPRYDRLKIAEIAGACGFNEIPYFNRCFRRRSGGPPMQFRGRSDR